MTKTLIKSYDLICDLAEEGVKESAELTFYADYRERRVVPEMVCPFLAVLLAGFPHFFDRRISLIRIVKASKHNSDAEEHKKLVLEIFREHRLFNLVKIK